MIPNFIDDKTADIWCEEIKPQLDERFGLDASGQVHTAVIWLIEEIVRLRERVAKLEHQT